MAQGTPDMTEISSRTARVGCALCANEAARIAALVRSHMGWVYAMARRRLDNAALAEDAAQTVFLVLCRRRRRMVGRDIEGFLVVSFMNNRTFFCCNAKWFALGSLKKGGPPLPRESPYHVFRIVEDLTERSRGDRLALGAGTSVPAARDLAGARTSESTPARG